MGVYGGTDSRALMSECVRAARCLTLATCALIGWYCDTFSPKAATCVDATRQVSHNCVPKLSQAGGGI